MMANNPSESCSSHGSSPSKVALVMGIAILAGCERPQPSNAAEQARISEGMEEVEAGQARSDANVAEIKAEESAVRREERKDDRAR